MSSPPIASEGRELFLKEMARLARDQLVFADHRHPATPLQLARSIARAVWRSDIALADRLLRGHPLIEDFTQVRGHRVGLTCLEASLARPSDVRWSAAERCQ
eukprot:2761248-Pyramimonas_sp.AAC.1